MEPALQEHAETLFRHLTSSVGQVIDLRVYFLAWTTDFITDQIFLNKTGLFWDVKKATDWFTIMWDFSGKFPLTKHFPWLVTTGLATPISLWRLLFPSFIPYISVYKSLRVMAGKAYDEHMQYQDHLTKPGREKDPGERDIFETLLMSDMPTPEKKPKRMTNEVYNLLVAGSLTTSKTLTIAVYHILANPPVLEQLKTELRGAIPEVSLMPDVRTLQQLPVLAAVIKETMRIACVVTTRFPMISRNKALEHNGSSIPAGSSISMTFCKAAIDPEIFHEPHKFRIERWLNQEQGPHDYERYVLPFGRGSRICVGVHLSYTQLYLVLAGIFRQCDLELFDTTQERDIDVKGGGPLGEPTRASKGVRVLVKDSA